MSEPSLSVDAEAARIEQIARTDILEARAALNALLARPSQLSGAEHRDALTFNAHLCSKLRERDLARIPTTRIRIWGDS